MVKPKKPINVEPELWRTLQEMKLEHSYKSLSEVISGLLVKQNKENIDNDEN